MVAARARTVQQLRRTWFSLGQYRDADVQRWIGRAVPLVTAGEWTIAQLTAAFFAQVAGIAEGARSPAERVDRSEVTGAGLRGVDPEVVYRRPAVSLYTALAGGAAFGQAVQVGWRRAESIANIDLQLARTRTVAGFQRITSYRRTLSGLENCDLCSSASTRTYYRGDLMPIHGNCDCGVIPVFSSEDVDSDDGEPGYEVRNHGEIGPVLVHPGQAFTGPDDF